MKLFNILIMLFCAVSCAEEKKVDPTATATTGPMKIEHTAPIEPTEKVVKTEEEWKKILTPEQYRVARQAGTERPNNDTYKQYKAQGSGTYYCASCDAKLFHSGSKINANCGWPAFYDSAKHENIITKEDFSGGYKRVEVLCAKCDSHLGHVFEGEGYNTPTDKRYCINGIILNFVPDEVPDEVAKDEAKEAPVSEEMPSKEKTPTEKK